MKSLLIILILLVFSLNLEAQVRRTTIRAFWQTIRNTITGETPPTPIIEKAFYVSSTYGNDSNPGTLEEPFQTLNKINSLALTDTSKVYFKRGDSFVGSLTVQSDSIIYDAYGTGDKPKIYGSELITGWTLHSGNIWKATFATTINQLFVNDERMQLARYPRNSDWNFAITTVNSTTQFISTDLASEAADYYKDATAILRANDWTVKEKLVTGSTGQTITIESAPAYALTVGYGFFLCNKLEFLTQAGDWYYDNATNTVYLWTPNGDTPANYEVRGSTFDNCIYANGKDNVTVKNIELLQAKNNGIDAVSCSDWNIENNTFSDFDNTAIRLSSAINNFNVSNNSISNIQHDGIYSVADNSTFTDNTLTDIALLKNFGTSGMENPAYSNAGRGIVSRGDNNVIRYNRLENIGFNAIRYGGINHTIEYNYIDSACVTVDDGGGIYCYNAGLVSSPGVAGSVVRYNMLENIIGNINGRPTGTGYKAYPIYLDNRVHDVLVEYNTIYNAGGHGIVQNPECGDNNIVRYNTVLSANVGIFANGANDIGNFNVNNNKVYVLDRNKINNADQCVIGYRYGRTLVSDSNIYVSHYNTDVFRNFVDGTNAIVYENFATWQTNTSQDANSTIDVTALPSNHTELILFNDTKSVKRFYTNVATVKDAFTGDDIIGSSTIQPFESKIVTGLDLSYISETQYETNPPVVETFTIEETSGGLVDILSFTVSGSPTKYLLTESATTPLRSDAWTDTAPTVYFTSTEGALTLYAWCMDEYGNISASVSDNTTISTLATIGTTTIGGLTTTTANTMRANSFVMPEDGYLVSMVVYHNTSTASVTLGVYSDNSASPNALLASTASAEISDLTEWQEIQLSEPLFVASGTTIWLAYNKSGTNGNFYVNSSTGLPRAFKSQTYLTQALTNPFGTATLDTGGSYSIYAKYVK